MVMLFHYALFLNRHQPVQRVVASLSELGWTGVDLFFVLSGFLITGILLDTPGASNYYSAFYAKGFENFPSLLLGPAADLLRRGPRRRASARPPLVLVLRPELGQDRCFLRRPLLVAGREGTILSSLAFCGSPVQPSAGFKDCNRGLRSRSHAEARVARRECRSLLHLPRCVRANGRFTHWPGVRLPDA